MSSSTPSQQNLSEENETPTTTTTVLGNFENPELDFPIKVGHVLFQLKKSSIKKVSEWATCT